MSRGTDSSEDVVSAARRPMSTWAWAALVVLAFAGAASNTLAPGAPRSLVILAVSLVELYVLGRPLPREAGVRATHNWALAAALSVVSLLLGVTALDRGSRGSIDSLTADRPANPSDPFAGTRSEAMLKAAYREPPAEALVVPLPSAKAGATSVLDDVPAATLKKARQVYAMRCAACHGDRGDGKGPGAFAVNPKPRNYADPEWQKAVTDDELGKAIVRGGVAVGKSYMMPASPDLRVKPEIVSALVALVRSFCEQ
jgi:mono/diheme cytochrome c family protein